MRDLILGTCVGYSATQIEPFLRTCRQHYKGGIAFFVGDCASGVEACLESYRVESLDLEGCKYPAIERFSHFLSYVERHPEVQRVFFTDVRDVVFQGDPFERLNDGCVLKVFEEGLPFSAQPRNQKWYRELYGDALEKIFEKPVLCVGTTFAGRSGALDYLSRMVAEIDRVPSRDWGVDQAVHNHLVYSNAFPMVEIAKNGCAEVQTLALQDRITISRDGVVLNPDGSKPAVLHQYDRHALLRQYFSSGGDEMTSLRRIRRSRSAAFRNFINVAVARGIKS